MNGAWRNATARCGHPPLRVSAGRQRPFRDRRAPVRNRDSSGYGVRGRDEVMRLTVWGASHGRHSARPTRRHGEAPAPRLCPRMSQMAARFYLSPPYMGDEELRLRQDTLASDWDAPVGPHVDAFRARVREAHSAPVVLSSGTAILRLSRTARCQSRYTGCQCLRRVVSAILDTPRRRKGAVRVR